MFFFFFFNDTATTEIYTLSLHDALPIFPAAPTTIAPRSSAAPTLWLRVGAARSEEHTSELQSHLNLVCRLLLEKKKTTSQSRLQPDRLTTLSPSVHRPHMRPTHPHLRQP